MNDRAYRTASPSGRKSVSDPSVSAWVSAHAGSGKTYVLTQRVLRLLLAGVPPSQILCLTFTKAAAANMSTRVFEKLAHWVVIDDDVLTREIESTGAETPSPDMLDHARRLFAKAVETPGGLKIQTIHAFCERLLHLFPFEANAPAGFRVLDDMARAELMESAKEHAIVRAMRTPGRLQEALACVARDTTSQGFKNLCDELLKRRDILGLIAGEEDYPARLRAKLGLSGEETLARIEAAMIRDHAEWPALAATLRSGTKNDAKLAAHLDRAIALAPHADCIESYLSVFYTEKRTPRGSETAKIVTRKLQDIPGFLDRMEAERDRLAPLIEKRKAAATAERSLALAALGDAIMAEYVRSKRIRNLLDYDDLIESARRLLGRSLPSWVLYKLDAQIEHILLDEAQDTSPRQWDILTALADEFFAGDSARPVARSFFAVGDEKQSIFSFQGAAPERFDTMRRHFKSACEAAGRQFEYAQLIKSYRSAQGVLDTVDEVFSFAENGRGLSCDPTAQGTPLKHTASKTHVDALVEIWEPMGPQDTEAPPDWRLPLDYAKATDPAERLARKVAAKIRDLVAADSGECVEDKGAMRALEPRDILIVVRKRGPLFEAMIRALKSENVPVAGADRLDLANHIAVNDLVALGRAALLVEDDLTLATLLKSPLVGFDDEDLIALAPDRPGALHDALAASGAERHKRAAARIAAWRRDAATLAPFEFYSRALGPDGGRRNLVARLGPEANDAIDEFLRLALSFEREQSSSLTSFLAMVEGLDLSIKRDMEAAGGAVRVMTAHAAKGLEAKVVFLPDTCSAPAGKHDPKLLVLGADDDVALVWSLGKDSEPEAISLAREAHRDAERAEHQRLLYVAMTRAEERLYIAGHHGRNGPADGCWHKMIVDALEQGFERASDADGYVLRRGGVPLRRDLARPVEASAVLEPPAFARTPAPRETAAAPPLRPSSALAGADTLAAFGAAAPTRRDAERLLVGRLTHALLQHLPGCPTPRRLQAAERFLSLRAPALDPERRVEIAQRATAIVEDPQLAALLGPQSVAEVDVVAALDGGIFVSGRIDRLAETAHEVMIADFKTGRPRESLDATQLRQLALYRAALAPLYPGKRLRCFIVWTQGATAVEAEAAMLDAALASALGGAGKG